MRRILLAWLCLLLPLASGHAAISAYEFDTPEQEQAFRDLTKELRCLVCQNQSIADSNAALAQDLRREIHTMLQAGQGKQEVIDFMVARYGDFVLYRPPVEPQTYGLWFGPVLLFIGGIVAVIVLVRRRSGEPADGALSEDERRRLAALLNEDGERK